MLFVNILSFYVGVAVKLAHCHYLELKKHDGLLCTPGFTADETKNHRGISINSLANPSADFEGVETSTLWSEYFTTQCLFSHFVAAIPISEN